MYQAQLPHMIKKNKPQSHTKSVQRKVFHMEKIFAIFFIPMSVARIRYLLIKDSKFAMLMWNKIKA